jgi:hypothetical protein
MRIGKGLVGSVMGFAFTVAGLQLGDLAQAANVVLFVSGTPLTAGDQALNDILLDLGHEVNVFDHNLPPLDQLFEADESDLVIVSESVTSGNIGGNLNDTEAPIINYEPYCFDDMGMTGPDGVNPGFGGFDYGFTTNDQTDVTIVSPTHPMAASLPAGDISVYTDPGIITWGQPTDEADVIARPADPEGDQSAAIFVYDKGDQMSGETAAGIRIGFFLHDRTRDASLLTEDGIALFEAAVEYALGVGQPVQLQAGDASMDYSFDQLDLVKVQVAAKYLTGQAATWGEGDWDGAPGGTQGAPPPGNGFFDQLDIIAALGHGLYLAGPYAALSGPEGTGDGNATLVYDANTGRLAVEVPGNELTSIFVTSESGIFTGDPAENLGGAFDTDHDSDIFKATLGSSFGSLSFGHVAQPGLSEEFVIVDLTATGTLAGGGEIGAVDLRYVPEPSSVMLLGLGLAGVLMPRRRRS